MSEKKVVDVGTIKKGSFIIFDGVACRVVSVDISRPGKHGHAKFRIVAVGLIDNKKRDVVMPHGSIEVPIIEKKTAQVLSVTGNNANVMDSESFETFDMVVPDELQGKVSEGVNVLYWKILEQRVMMQAKGD